VQFAIFGFRCLIAWASEGFFSGRGLYWIARKFFQGGAKSGEICFFLLETKKTTFFAEIFKVQVGPKSSPALLSDAHV